MQFILVCIVSLLAALARVSAAEACSCTWSTDAVILHDAQIIAEVSIEALNPGPEPDAHIATARVLKAWKGLEDGAEIKIVYWNDSCGGVPSGNSDKDVYFTGRDGYLAPALCMPIPGEALLEAYRQNRTRLEQAAAARPDDVAAQLALARYLVEWNEAKPAAQMIERLVAVAPNNANVRFLEARRLLNQAGENSARLRAAHAAFGRVLEVDPSNTLAPLLQTELINQIARAEKVEGGAVPAKTEVPRTSLKGRNLNLERVDLTGLSLRSLDFGAIDAARSDWTATGVSGDFSGADLSDAILKEADWGGTHLSGARMRRVRAAGAKFTFADLSGADLISADLSFTDMGETNLAGANLRGANLTGAELFGADLRGADLQDARVDQLSISFDDGSYRAKIDCKTRLPQALKDRLTEFEQVESCGSPAN